jgi:predicted ATPase with chaperone activity
MEIAAAGGHNIFNGPPGAGKTMLAVTVFTTYDFAEALETTKIQRGKLKVGLMINVLLGVRIIR